MSSDPSPTSTFWTHRMLRRHRAAALPAGSALSDPPESLDPDTAKAGLEQVGKRLDAELALKTSTETRALTLAGQCTTLLSALTAAVLVEAYGSHRLPLMAAGIAGAACLFAAVLFAYNCATPRANNVLPGRLPDELWDDFVAPGMKGPEFIGRLMLSLQDVMVQNERNQNERASALRRAIFMVKATMPVAIIAAGLALAVTTLPASIATRLPGPAAAPTGGNAAPTPLSAPTAVRAPPGASRD